MNSNSVWRQLMLPMNAQKGISTMLYFSFYSTLKFFVFITLCSQVLDHSDKARRRGCHLPVGIVSISLV